MIDGYAECGRGGMIWWHAGENSDHCDREEVDGQRSSSRRSQPDASLRSFITSTIISSARSPARRADHRSRGSLVVVVAFALVALIVSVLSMYVLLPPSLSALPCSVSQTRSVPGPPPEPPSHQSTSRPVSPHSKNSRRPMRPSSPTPTPPKHSRSRPLLGRVTSVIV